MYNLETLITLGIQQDIRGRQTQNVQSRDTDNIGYTTRYKRKTNTECTIQRNWQHWVYNKTWEEDKHRMYNIETLTTLGI
jgi:hypothetical protein